MSEKRVVKYDTGRGFYVTQYVGGTIVVAIEGRAQVVQQTSVTYRVSYSRFSMLIFGGIGFGETLFI